MATETNTQNDEAHVASLQQEAAETLRSKSFWQRALWYIRHDYLTLIALVVIALLAAISYSAPVLVNLLLDIEYNDPDLYNSYLAPGASVTDSDSTVLQWLVETGESRRAFVGHTQQTQDIDYSSGGELFVSVSADQTVRVWDISSGRNIRKLEILNDPDTFYTVADFAPSGDAFVIADNKGVVTTWEPEKASRTDDDVPLVEIPAHDAAINSIEYSPNSQQILTGSDDETAKLWDTASGNLMLDIDAGEPVKAVSFNNDGSLIAIANDSGIVAIWALGTAEVVQHFDVGSTVQSVEFSTDGLSILTADVDGFAKVWNLVSGDLLQFFEHPSQVNAAHFANDDTAILTGSADGTARLWDLRSGTLKQIFGSSQDPAVLDAAMHPDGETILTATEGRERRYLLGTDGSGRDHLSRLMFAGQISLKIGFLAAVGALTIGIVVGVIAGYFGGIVDDFIMWVITTLNSIPALYLLLIVSALLSPNANSLILVLVVLGWTGAARIVRGETFSIRERDYVMAARAIGASDMRIMFVHIVPNVISLLLIVLSRSIGGLILAESTLSFLGFGVKPPTPTWGNMLSGDLSVLRDSPHLVFAPGLLITVTVLCLYIIGDGVRDAFDPNISD